MALMDDFYKTHMKPVQQISDIPQGEHYVIVEIASVDIPGDERSRTNPGHGYPAHTEHYTRMRVTTDRAVWEKEIADMVQESPRGAEKFVAYHVPAIAKISRSVKVDVS
jgi:hypothetical protein